MHSKVDILMKTKQKVPAVIIFLIGMPFMKYTESVQCAGKSVDIL